MGVVTEQINSLRKGAECMNFQCYEIIDIFKNSDASFSFNELFMELEYFRTQDNLYISDTYVNG